MLSNVSQVKVLLITFRHKLYLPLAPHSQHSTAVSSNHQVVASLLQLTSLTRVLLKLMLANVNLTNAS